jgi:hypothetical protein
VSALYRSHFFLDSIPGAVNVIAGGGILFIMFHMEDRPAGSPDDIVGTFLSPNFHDT